MRAQIEVHRLNDVTDACARPVVVAVHGITANAMSFVPLAEQLNELAVWAPDLRGRACSRDVGRRDAAYGLHRHADDLVPVLQEAVRAAGRPAVLLGHSMGAFVSAIVAARHPELVSALVLVDGGLAFPVPQAVADDPDAALQAVIGPAMTRLSMTFASPQAYLDFWADHPAVGELTQQRSPVGEQMRGYLLHDLVESDGQWTSSCRVAAIRADGAMTLADGETHAAARAAVAAGVPSTLLWAPRGLLDEPQGLYDETRLAALDLPPELTVERVDDTNHYTVLFAEHGVRRVAEAVRAAL